jgi:hypothetical protein
MSPEDIIKKKKKKKPFDQIWRPLNTYIYIKGVLILLILQGTQWYPNPL